MIPRAPAALHERSPRASCRSTFTHKCQFLWHECRVCCRVRPKGCAVYNDKLRQNSTNHLIPTREILDINLARWNINYVRLHGRCGEIFDPPETKPSDRLCGRRKSTVGCRASVYKPFWTSSGLRSILNDTDISQREVIQDRFSRWSRNHRLHPFTRRGRSLIRSVLHFFTRSLF